MTAVSSTKVALRPQQEMSAALPATLATPAARAHIPSLPEVRLWDIALLAKSYCGTCPRTGVLGSFTDHFDGLPTNRQSGFVNTAPLPRTYPQKVGFNIFQSQLRTQPAWFEWCCCLFLALLR